MNASSDRAANPRRPLPPWVRPLIGAFILLAAALVVDDELLSANWMQVQAAVGALPAQALLFRTGEP